MPTSPTSLGRPSSPPAVDRSSPECAGYDVQVPAESRDHTPKDEAICGSLEFSSEFWKVVTDIRGLVDESRDGTAAQTAGNDESSASRDDVIHMDDDRQVRVRDVRVTSPSDVTGGQDAVSVEQEKQTGDVDVRIASCPPSDDDTELVMNDANAHSPTQSQSFSAQLLSLAENGESEDAGVKPSTNGVDKPCQLSAGEVVKQSLKSDDEAAETNHHSARRTDAGSRPGVQSRDKFYTSPDADRVCLQSQTDNLVSEKQSSDSSRDLTPHSALTVSSSCTHERSPSKDDNSEVGELKLIDQSTNRLEAVEPALVEYQSERDVSQPDSKLSVFSDDQQSLFNEDSSESLVGIEFVESDTVAATADDRCSACLTLPVTASSASETGKQSPSPADPAQLRSGFDTNSSDITDDLAEFTQNDDGVEKSPDSKTIEMESVTGGRLEVTEDASDLEDMNLLLAVDSSSSSSSLVHCLDTTDLVDDDYSSSESSSQLEASFFYRFDETVAATGASSSSSVGSSPVTGETVAVQQNAIDYDQTLECADEDTRPCGTDVNIDLNLPPPTPSPPPPPPSSSVAESFEMNSFWSEEDFRRHRRDQQRVHEDVMATVTNAESLSSSESSVVSQSSSMSSADSNVTKSSESSRLATYSAESGSESNSAVFERRRDSCGDFRDVPLTRSGTGSAVTPIGGSAGDIAAGETPHSAAKLADNCLASETSGLRQIGDTGPATKFAGLRSLAAISIGEHPVHAPPTTSLLPASERSTHRMLNGTVQTHNVPRSARTMSGDERPETKIEQTENVRNFGEPQRERQAADRERDETTRPEVVEEVDDQPPLPLSHPPTPPAQIATYFSSDDSLRMPDHATKTAERKDCEFPAMEETFLRTSTTRDLPVVSGETRSTEVTAVRRESKVAAECDSRQTDERGSRPASKAEVLLSFATKADSRVPENKTASCNYSRSTSLRSDSSRLFRSPTPVVVRHSSQTDGAVPGEHADSGGFFGTATKPPTATCSAAKGRELRPTTETVPPSRTNGSQSAASSRNHDADRSGNIISEHKMNHHRPLLPTTTDNSSCSSIIDVPSAQADDKERAKTLLQSVLAPLCCKAGGRVTPIAPQWLGRAPVERQDTPPTRRESRRSDDDDCAGSLSSNDETADRRKSDEYLARRPRHHRPTSLAVGSHFAAATVPLLRRGGRFRDDNNNDDDDKQAAADRDDVIRVESVTSSEGRRYKVAISLGPFSLGPPPAAAAAAGRRRPVELDGDDDVAMIRSSCSAGTFSLDRAAGGGGGGAAAFRRSLSLPVVDRSETFIVAAASATADRDRVRPPPLAARLQTPPPPTSPPPPPPARFQSSRRTLGVVSEF